MSARRGPLRRLRAMLGRRVAPPRFLLFIAVFALVALGLHAFRDAGLADAVVTGFDLAVIAFATSLLPLGKPHGTEAMRLHAEENDANRLGVLVITALVSLTVMLAMVGELPDAHAGQPLAIVRLIATLALGWLFTNLVFMLHYAHLHYSSGESGTGIAGGFDFPGTAEPDYWDFLYFAFTAGMSFAASDVDVTRTAVRRIVILQCLLSFAFNIGALAFCINVLAGAAS